MEDMDKVRAPFGTVADLSKWDINQGGFQHMKLSSTEKVIEPTDEIQESTSQVSSEKLKEEKQIEKMELPNNQKYVNPVELKNIAIRLMPSDDKVNSEDYDIICEKAIDLAFNFLKVWDLKVEITK